MRIVLSTILILLTTVCYSKTMGLDVMLVSKDKEENQIFYSKLSRSFCNFLCGPDAYENSEFEQIQEFTGLDLGLFRSYPVNLEPDIHELEYKLYLAEEENNATKIEFIKSEIERTEKEWEENFDIINEGWMNVDELKKLTNHLISKLKENKKVYKTINYNFNWKDYFEYKIRKPKDDFSYMNNTLVEDLESLLVGLEQMSQKGVTFVAFYYG